MIGAVPEIFMPIINSEKAKNIITQFISESQTKLLIVSKFINELKEDYMLSIEINDIVLKM